MDTRRHTAQTRASKPKAAIALLAAGALFWCGGCKAPSTDVDWHGQQELMAVYRTGTLHTTVPADVPVHSVIAAAEMELERRGYTITSTDSTDDRGHVIARPEDGRSISKVNISARLTDEGTGISIRTYPGGHEHPSRDMLERILTRLGL